MSETSERAKLEAIFAGLGIEINDETLAHYGVPGMRWGKRGAKATSGGDSGSSSSSAPKKKTVKDLSDDELKTMINRIKLEQEFIKLTTPQKSKGRKAVDDFLAAEAKKQVPVVLGLTGKAIKGMLSEGSGRHRG